MKLDDLPIVQLQRGYFVDTGCDLAPSCLNCPFKVCRYDLPGGERALMNESRDSAIIEAYYAGDAAEVLAKRFRLSVRTIRRVVSGH